MFSSFRDFLMCVWLINSPHSFCPLFYNQRNSIPCNICTDNCQQLKTEYADNCQGWAEAYRILANGLIQLSSFSQKGSHTYIFLMPLGSKASYFIWRSTTSVWLIIEELNNNWKFRPSRQSIFYWRYVEQKLNDVMWGSMIMIFMVRIFS